MARTVGYPVKLTSRPSKKVRDALIRARLLLAEGREYREQKRHRVWRQSEKQYFGDHWSATDRDDPRADLLTVNMSFSTVNTIVPYITGSAPSFLVEPYSQDATIRNAKAQEALLNRLWSSRRMDGQGVLADGAVDALVYGDGYVKVGFDYRSLRTSADGDEAISADLWVKRVSPWDVWIDPHANSLSDARWVAQRMRIARREVENDPRFFNTSEENLHPITAKSESDSDRPDVTVEQHGEPTDLVEIWDFYDRVDNTMVTFGEGELPLRFIEEVGEVPLVPIGDYPIPGSPYHMGELEQLWSLQQELNKTRSQMATHRRRNVSKFVARKNVFDSKALEALQSAVVNDVALVDTANDLQDLIQPLHLPPLQADVYAMSDQIGRDIYEISGVNEYLRGATPTIRRTATEATIIEGASNVKTADKLRMVERAAREIGFLLLAIAKDVYPETEYDEIGLYLTGRSAERLNRVDVQAQADRLAAAGDIAGADQLLADPGNIQADAILRPTPDIWVGDYEVIVEQASTELRSPAMREQKYRGMIQTLAGVFPILQQSGVPINWRRLLELWFEASGIEDIDSMFDNSGMMDPMMAMMGGQGGGFGPQTPGEPQTANAMPPQELLDAMNTGMLPPQ